MEEVLDLYEEPYSPKRPMLCFDEIPKQIIAEVRELFSAEQWASARYDIEYERKGVCDLMIICVSNVAFAKWPSRIDEPKFNLPTV